MILRAIDLGIVTDADVERMCAMHGRMIFGLLLRAAAADERAIPRDVAVVVAERIAELRHVFATQLPS